MGENDDVGIRRHVDLGDRPAAGDLEPVHPEVIGSAGDHHAVDELLAVAHLTADLAHRHGPADRRHVRDDPLEVLAEEAVGDAHPSVAVAAARLLRRLDAADDDARGPEILDLLLGLIAHPLPHRHQPDDGRDAALPQIGWQYGSRASHWPEQVYLTLRNRRWPQSLQARTPAPWKEVLSQPIPGAGYTLLKWTLCVASARLWCS